MAIPPIFKGIALFTPAGDLIYAIDPKKQGRWHAHLCARWQEVLGLSEPPHFLIPGYTATLDRWLNPKTQQIQTFAQLYPPVQRHQTLLNAIFETPGLIWRVAPWQEEACEPMVIESYRSQFPQLWEEKDLIIADERVTPSPEFAQEGILETRTPLPPSTNYVLRLFVSGDGTATEKTLKRVHELLEEGLHFPYTLKVIDIFKDPEQAEANQVSAIPTLMRAYPYPVRRIVGALDDSQKIIEIIAMR